MLLQFAVENFLSFREKVVLSFLAAEGVEHRPGQVCEVGGHSVVRVCALYGANAAGKSNLIKALVFAQNLIVLGRDRGAAIAPTAFRLDASRKGEPSSFEFMLAIGEDTWEYGFRVGATEVEEEWLLRHRGERQEQIFERVASSNGGKPDITMGPLLLASEADEGFHRYVARSLRANQLFLTHSADQQVALLEPLIRWFETSLLSLGDGTAYLLSMARILGKNDEMRQFSQSLLASAGTGVDQISIEKETLGDEERERWQSLRAGGRKDLITGDLEDTGDLFFSIPDASAPFIGR
jgi:hypothetical protein